MIKKEKVLYTVQDIMEVLPHRYPFLLVDAVVALQDYESCTGIKSVSFNEPQFQGHFPGHPIMPGVMLVESMAQTASLMALIPEKSKNFEMKNKVIYFMSIDEVKFRKPVVPGDKIYIETKKIKARGMIWKFSGVVSIEGEAYAEAKFTAMIKEK